MKRFLLPVLATILGGLAVGYFINSTKTVRLKPMKGRVNIVEAERDPELAAAVLRARKELPDFIRALKSPTKTQREFAVNARYDTDQGPEMIWLRVSSYEDGTFEGTVADQPLAIRNLKMGDKVEVPESVINDWLYRDGIEIVGGYTMKLLLERTKPSP